MYRLENMFCSLFHHPRKSRFCRGRFQEEFVVGCDDTKLSRKDRLALYIFLREWIKRILSFENPFLFLPPCQDRLRAGILFHYDCPHRKKRSRAIACNWNEAVGNSKSEKKYFFFNREKIQKKASFGEALCKSCVIDEYGIAIFFVKSPVNICLLVIFPLI